VKHRRRASPLHVARAGVAAVWCVVYGVVALSLEQPLVLGALLAGVLAAAVAAHAGRQVARVLAWGVPFAVVIALVNALVVREGLTVLLRGGTAPGLGRVDVTLEAVVYGGVLGLRALVVIGCAALLTAAVDPDELLRAVRRLSFRSGVTAALATRLMPVLARDARRLADAQRCRGADAGPRTRLAVLRAVTAGALDRATDVAATLEVRGFGAGHRPAPRRRPWSRHDLAFAASALGMAALGVAAGLEGWAPFDAYPRTSAPLGAGTLLLTGALLACALLPFADRRGIE
jgi:energy-coupling factor transport system permease protein